MYDIGIIGAGPAGYTAAIRASQNGLSVILFEKDYIGGTCLNKGCIPTKTVLYSAKIYKEMKNSSKYGIEAENIGLDFSKVMERQRTVADKIRRSLTSLIKGYNITIVEGKAEIESEHVIKCSSGSYEVKNIIIATGSKPNKIRFNGNYSEDFVLDSNDILNLEKLPENILIVGSGAIGIEWARILSAFGVKVYLVEMMEKLIPSADIEISERVVRLFKKSRIEFYTSTTIENIENRTVLLSNGKVIEPDFVFLGAGRIPEIDFGKINSGIKKDKFIEAESGFKTNIGSIYAIGDVNGISMLAHSAARQAEDVIDYIITGKCNDFDKDLVPAVIYGTPEIAYIGKTEQQLQKDGIEYKKSFFPISALGKAYAEDKIEGFIKILATDSEILGAHIIAEEASALIEQIAIAMTNHLSPEDIEKVIYAHPTYSEGIHEGLQLLNNRAINVPNVK